MLGQRHPDGHLRIPSIRCGWITWWTRTSPYWHSATFNNDGTKVIFTDEWGGGTRPRCRASDLPNWGANAIFDIVDRKLRFASYFKMPAPQTEQENCVAHNGSLIPVPGRDIMVQAWYQGGVSVFDFTDSANPVEIAFFDRGPVDPKQLITAGYWSTYWYNGHIYGTEIARGIDVFRLKPSAYLSENEIAAAVLVHATGFNAQQQTRITWPASTLVARAYLDQLARTKGICPPARRPCGRTWSAPMACAPAVAAMRRPLSAGSRRSRPNSWPTRRRRARETACACGCSPLPSRTAPLNCAEAARTRPWSEAGGHG